MTASIGLAISWLAIAISVIALGISIVMAVSINLGLNH